MSNARTLGPDHTLSIQSIQFTTNCKRFFSFSSSVSLEVLANRAHRARCQPQALWTPTTTTPPPPHLSCVHSCLPPPPPPSLSRHTHTHLIIHSVHHRMQLVHPSAHTHTHTKCTHTHTHTKCTHTHLLSAHTHPLTHTPSHTFCPPPDAARPP
jgi:hypothetical protein